MKKINKNNTIFTSEPFQKDKYKFYLITQNLKSKSVVLYSDEENYVICRGVVGFPTWIWTKDDFDTSKLKEIEQAIELYLTDSDKDKFTCKKKLYDLLVSDGFSRLNLEDYFEMGTLNCKQTKKPKDCDGSMTIPSIDDKSTLIQYWFDASQEMRGGNPISLEQSEDEVNKMFNSNRLYIWKNADGKIVCMVNYNEIDGQAKLSHVYTPVEERGKGYAANLIYSLTNHLLAKGLVPLLYTDYNYPASNKAYMNAGYEDTGILINFTCSKVKKNTIMK